MHVYNCLEYQEDQMKQPQGAYTLKSKRKTNAPFKIKYKT